MKLLKEKSKESHQHGEEKEEEGGRGSARFLYFRLVIGVILLAVSYLSSISDTVSLTLNILAFLIVGCDLIAEAGESIFHKDFFNEHTLMLLAGIGAILLGEGHEAVIIVLFAQIGEILEDKAVGRSRRSLESLLKLAPDTVNILQDHSIRAVPAESIRIGQRFMVFAGERVALDGKVVSGCSEVDVSSITGESLPVPVGEGTEVLSGSINLTGTITVEAEQVYADSAAVKIMKLVENARESKGKATRFVTRFARVYTPCVFLCALVVGLLIPLIFRLSFAVWLHKALLFLVVSCPCALVISIPLSYFAGIGGATRHGVLFKSADVVDKLFHVSAAAFDKTGTLTAGHFTVQDVIPAEGVSREYLLEIAAYAETRSNHPLARSFRETFPGYADPERVLHYKELSGKGCVAERSDHTLCIAGNSVLMEEFRIMDTLPELGTAVIYVSDGKRYCGCISFSDSVRPDAKNLIERLSYLGIRRCAVVSGDTKTSTAAAAKELGISEIYAGCLPADKLRIVRDIRSRMPKGRTVLFTGDGINDAPVLAAADIGIAMGALGSDAAIEAADVVITTDELMKVSDAIEMARNVRKIIMENIIFSLGVKFLIMILALFGAAPMLLAVFADVGVSTLAILNAIRLLKK